MNNYGIKDRRKSKKIMVSNVGIGGDSSISVQSMTNTKTYDVKSTIQQIHALEEYGCDIIRVAVPDQESAEAISKIKRQIHIPLVADIQFDYRLAIESIRQGADAIRINPGNIGDAERVREIVQLAKAYQIPIRIGVNSGSIEKDLLHKYGKPTPEAMVESALRHIEILENMNFSDIVVSLKSSDVLSNILAYKMMALKVDYPLHLGITEAGTLINGTVKSSVGLGILLYEGIGDTIRVSLTGEPSDEVKVGIEILKSLNLREGGINLISCPTCGRTEVDLISIAKEIEEKLANVKKPLKVAVMGCIVNGPGEAKEADIGIAGGKKKVAIFKKGEIIKTVSEEDAVSELIREINEIVNI
ncbi:1-hydroxy-2-methyl-2-(E)-butenyl 4-diphosphate synthase [Tepidanaerobacter acetatoxydans Re1]|uniref:4-hydroxy-3-methylbut-2-en-1-yl diphosphate synthase (flavodoxin) n=1 Tax=Tepidanaerobacter acetatoxydans (strain DSM 21804 / JCM 16047 / Re1) TaxID=1209989 RepID=F4LU78_TEPAE|nr:flavodoxin-dependent (E)-4-hydroxy-3-methylbut-2-enyl-diphosphate synthase [Tepidanaerobacter acetatoxydans]AEE91408.1 4-hydroxy-3-methylbut-2-en-1-yl diphosphate synthase [Tepidanaerobacter acetatoxydans Re1]CCP26109.2 1-hydroxy-2-methyl-2-(E)-butenyl 4-diphosphate synthase [Tepidanaerobacter acetatoxydans Re1]